MERRLPYRFAAHRAEASQKAMDSSSYAIPARGESGEHRSPGRAMERGELEERHLRLLAFVIASAALGQAVGGEGLFDPLTRTATIDGRARESTPPGQERWICNDWGLLFGRRPAAQA